MACVILEAFANETPFALVRLAEETNKDSKKANCRMQQAPLRGELVSPQVNEPHHLHVLGFGWASRGDGISFDGYGLQFRGLFF